MPIIIQNIVKHIIALKFLIGCTIPYIKKLVIQDNFLNSPFNYILEQSFLKHF